MSDPDRGLAFDLTMLTDRRRLLGWVAAAAMLDVLGCEGVGVDGEDGDGTGGLDDGTCSAIPEETAGPYPGDGTNGPNALTLSDIVRSDIRSSIGTLSGTAEGVPLTLRLRLVDASACAPLAGYAVYLWHCDRDGAYSMYGRTDQNWLRGVQVSDDDGYVTFVTIFPGCYSGRWPHAHFEVYDGLDAATNGRAAIATSQLALPASACDEAYTAAGYEESVENFAQADLSSDNVFGDGASTQIPTMSGDVDNGFEAALEVGV